MVPPAGKETRVIELRALNSPRPVWVRADRRGVPLQLRRPAREPVPVTRIRDRWRVDDSWWREPLCRMYWELELVNGEVVTLFHDRIADRWYQQPYG